AGVQEACDAHRPQDGGPADHRPLRRRRDRAAPRGRRPLRLLVPAGRAVRRLLVLAAAATVCAVVTAPAGATNECRGLQVCVPVTGPWVLAAPGEAQFELACPKRFV